MGEPGFFQQSPETAHTETQKVHFLTVKMIEHWHGLSREIDKSSLDIFNNCLDMVLCSCLWVTALREVIPYDLQRYLPTSVTLWSLILLSLSIFHFFSCLQIVNKYAWNKYLWVGYSNCWSWQSHAGNTCWCGSGWTHKTFRAQSPGEREIPSFGNCCSVQNRVCDWENTQDTLVEIDTINTEWVQSCFLFSTLRSCKPVCCSSAAPDPADRLEVLLHGLLPSCQHLAWTWACGRCPVTRSEPEYKLHFNTVL